MLLTGSRDLVVSKILFDYIFFNDVLEHMVEPWSALLRAKTLLKTNGFIVSSIPNVLHFRNILNVLISQDWKYEDAGIMDKTHLRFFSKKSIIRLYEECNFDVVKIVGINESYGSLRRIFKLINLILFNHLDDMRFIQFLTIAQSK